VVREGRTGDCSPYPDLEALAANLGCQENLDYFSEARGRTE